MSSNREIMRIQIQTLRDQKMSFYEIAKRLDISYKTARKWSDAGDIKHRYNTKQVTKLTPNTRRRITGRITGLMKDRIGSSIAKCTKTLNFSSN